MKNKLFHLEVVMKVPMKGENLIETMQRLRTSMKECWPDSDIVIYENVKESRKYDPDSYT